MLLKGVDTVLAFLSSLEIKRFRGLVHHGLVLLDNLRRLDHYKETPVIVVSTDQSRQTIEEFQRLKAGAIIAKSEFKRGKLLEAIKELMGEE